MRKPNQVPDSLKSVNVKALLRSRGVYLKLKVNREMKQAAIPMAQKLIDGKKKAPEVQRYLHYTNEEAKIYCEKQIHIVHIIEEKFDRKVQQFIDKIVRGFLNELEHTKAKDYFEDETDNLLVEAQLDFAPMLESVATLAGQEAYDLLHSKDVYIPHDYRKEIAKNVAKFTQSMIDTDREKLINMLDQGLKNGEALPKIREDITRTFGEYNKSQAQRITKTEVSRTSIQAQVDAYQQSGVVEGLQWVLDGGHDVPDDCDNYDGEIVAVDESFYKSDNEFQDGNPPIHPNCNCELLPVLIDNADKVYVPQVNKAMQDKIKELEAQIDKRTKEYRDIKESQADDRAYIKALENLVGDDE